jgi:hypothetical protein
MCDRSRDRGILVLVDALRPARQVGRDILTALDAMRPLLDHGAAREQHPGDLDTLAEAFNAVGPAIDPPGQLAAYHWPGTILTIEAVRNCHVGPADQREPGRRVSLKPAGPAPTARSTPPMDVIASFTSSRPAAARTIVLRVFSPLIPSAKPSTESAGRMWVVLPALLPRVCPGGGVASGAWVPA